MISKNCIKLQVHHITRAPDSTHAAVESDSPPWEREMSFVRSCPSLAIRFYRTLFQVFVSCAFLNTQLYTFNSMMGVPLACPFPSQRFGVQISWVWRFLVAASTVFRRCSLSIFSSFTKISYSDACC